MAQAIYREWFVHFRFPGHEDATFVDSPLGSIPEGWSVRPVQEVADARRGYSWDRSIETEDDAGTRVATIPNIRARLDMSGCTRLTDVTAADVERFSIRADDILMIGSNGNPERVAYSVRAPADTADLFASFLMRVRSKPDQTDPLLLFHQLRDPDGVLRQVRSTAVGATGLRNLRITVLRDALVTVPDRATSQGFQASVRPAIALADQLDEQQRALAAIRDLLLPELVTGQIDVSELDLDALVEAVA